MSALLPCPGCARHVRAGEARCPFCDASVGDVAPPLVRRVASSSLTRALIFSGAAAVALAACEEQPVAQPYGAPPDPDSGGETQPPPEQQTPPPSDPQQPPPDDSAQPTSPDDPGQPMLMYGGPPG